VPDSDKKGGRLLRRPQASKGHPLKTTKIFATIAIAAISVSALAGCIQTPEVDEPRAIVTSTPEPTETVEPVEPLVGDIDGDGELSRWEAEQLAKQSYILPDGTAVPLVKGQPLPPQVVAAVQASVLAQAGPATDGPIEERGAQANAAVAAVEAESAKLGTTIVPVFYAYNGNTGSFSWSVGGVAAGSIEPSEDEASAVAAAQAWIGAQTDRYTVMVFA